eukprot:CAMPEP_0185695622 /NCGR_PEP_ID=MMETSP1164-20130828/4630_1 /TAXON_ID=1104430 /ORGANISM="Chrysoreinhardia sp, Strain CCMP2950" /LENGTH=1438 /DNA_ID=CAMNT_0028362483 /DNA_START=33 /DNA_END=4349 /DNA_ORIENTATION=+
MAADPADATYAEEVDEEPPPPQSILSFWFGRLGYALGGKKTSIGALIFVLAGCWALGSGLFATTKSIVDTDLFDSLLLRPRTRVQRESDWVSDHEDEGYSSGSEATNGRATRGGKNVLTRKNLEQVANFWEGTHINDIAIEHRGVRYETFTVLALAGPSQPYRFTILDCFQEGVYDYVGDVRPLSASAGLIVNVVDEFMAPFLGEDADSGVRVTPYNWCLYLRVGIPYAPSTLFDEALFGRCRQFIREDPGREYDPLVEAYDFHRFLAYDWARQSPSLIAPWGCLLEFRDPMACHPVLSCCEVKTMYANCAACELDETSQTCSGEWVWEDVTPGPNATEASLLRTLLPSGEVSRESCDELATLFGIDDWAVNPQYDASYAEDLPSCAAFEYYPMSSLYASLIGASAAIAESTDTSDCPERFSVFDADPDQHAVVTFAGLEMYCRMFYPAPTTCPAQLDADDFDWRFLDAAVATERELNERAASGTCAHWDGGPDGALRLLPYIANQVIMGDLSRPNGVTWETKALQTVQVSNGWKVIRDALRQAGETVSTKRAKEGRSAYLSKYRKIMHGRYDGKSMIFGTYSSGGGGSAAESAEAQVVPETYLVILAYGLILIYTVVVVIASGDPSNRRRVLLDGGLAVAGVILVFSGLVAGMGIAIYAGLKFNPTSVQVLPFLVLGLGINDLYVLTHRHLELLSLLRGRHPVGGGAGLAAQVAADAGASVTITTFANVCVFVVAAVVIKMRMIAQFSLMAACSLAGTWFAIVFGFTACVAIHADLVCKAFPKDEAATSAKPGFAETFTANVWMASRRQNVAQTLRRDRSRQYALLIASNKRVALVIVVCISAAVAAICAVGLPIVELNYAVNYLFPRRSSEDIFWRTKLRFLPNNFFDLHTGESDFSRKHPLLAATAEEALDPAAPARYSLLTQVMRAKKVLPGQEGWYNVFIQWNYPCAAWSFASNVVENELPALCEDSAWYGALHAAYNPRCSSADALTEPAGACGPVVSESFLTPAEFSLAPRKAELFEDPSNDLSTPLIPACTAWPVQYFVCDGAPCFGPSELTPELYAAVQNNETLVFGVHPSYFYECFNLFLRHDEAHVLRSPVFNCEDPDRPSKRRPCVAVEQSRRSIWRGKSGDGEMRYSQTILWAAGLKDGQNWLKFFSSLRRKLNDFVSRTDVDAYPHGTFFTFYYQFTFIRRVMVEAFGYSALVVFGLTLVLFLLAQKAETPPVVRFLEAAAAAVLILAAVAIVIVGFIALMGLTGLWLNCFTLATVIVSFGIAIEATAHTAFGFLAADGTPTQRATEALNRYFLPISDGAFTTFLGFAPIAASKYLYVVMYYFLIYAILVAFAYVVGVVFFPALLAVVGRATSGASAAAVPVVEDDAKKGAGYDGAPQKGDDVVPKQPVGDADADAKDNTEDDDDDDAPPSGGKRPPYSMEVDL